jgi:hypothetical protein
MVFDIRLRLFTDAGARSRVLKTQTLDVTMTDSGSPSLRFSTSARVAGYLAAPFLVGVEYSVGGAWVQPRNGLMIADNDEGDSIDPGQAASFTAIGFVPWLLQHMYVQGTADLSMVDGERQFTTPGHAMKALIDHAKITGWGPNLTYDFTNTLDSAGAAWQAAEKPPTMKWLTPMSQVLASMSELGLCEWWTEGQQLRLFRPGVGLDKTNVKLGGKGYTRAPAKSSFTDVFTHLSVLLGGANNAYVNLVNTGADTRFGNLWATMTQSGVDNVTDATRLAQGALIGARTLKRELSYEWAVVGEMPVPWVELNVGDVVQARTRNGWVEQRIVGLVVTKGETVTVRAVVGDRLLTAAARMARRTSAATVGTIISGSGDAFPADPSTPTLSLPKAPTGVAVTENTAVWGTDGSAVTRAVVSWNAVTQNLDNSGVTIAEYEVWMRAAADLSTLLRVTPNTSTVLEGLPPGVARFVKVRARSVDGRLSDFSSEISVTPVTPGSIIPKAPTSLAAASNTAAFGSDGAPIATIRLSWAAVTQATDNSAIIVDAYELLDTTNGGTFAPVQLSAERIATIVIPSGLQRKYRVRARSALGVWGDPSTEITVTAATPTQVVTAPSAPVLTSAFSLVIPVWNGLLTSGAPPAGFQHLITERAEASGGPWTVVGVPAVAAGQTAQFRALPGSTAWVRFKWVDTLGRVSGVSAAASVLVTGVTGPDVEANAILANHIKAGEIEVGHLAAGVGGSLDISANGAVTTIITQQNEQAAATAAAVEAAAEAAGAAATAAAIASGATADAAAAAGAAAAAAAAQAATQAQLDLVQTWFRVDIDGAHVGQTGNPFQANVLPGEFNITESGVRTTWWDGGRMTVPALVTTEVALSNHKFEKFGTGTVIRALG